jgi:hypothetical protein
VRVWSEDNGDLRHVHWLARYCKPRKHIYGEAQGGPARAIRGKHALQQSGRTGRNGNRIAYNGQLGNLQAAIISHLGLSLTLMTMITLEVIIVTGT